MFKTIITIAALATLAATTIAPAHAIVIVNGGGENGGGENGWSNGGGENGANENGAAGDSSTLSILAIELPPETR